MIKIFSMSTCPDCEFIEEQVKGNSGYEIIDIGSHVKNLKAFLHLRDSDPAFDAVKRAGTIGIPCFVLENGHITLKPEEAGLIPNSREKKGTSCRLDGSGC